MVHRTLESNHDSQFVIRPNRSLTWRQTCIVFAVATWRTRPNYAEHELPLVLKYYRGMTDEWLAARNAPRPETDPAKVKEFLLQWIGRGDPYYSRFVDWRDAGLLTLTTDKNDSLRVRSFGMFGCVWVFE